MNGFGSATADLKCDNEHAIKSLAEEVSRQLRQILNHQLQSPEVRRKVLIVNTRTLSVTADCEKAELSTTIHDPKVN